MLFDSKALILFIKYPEEKTHEHPKQFGDSWEERGVKGSGRVWGINHVEGDLTCGGKHTIQGTDDVV